ncbi:hypothetical protein QR680_014725 [Steinernema hermaphroditum]|uniref:Pepsin inhibitor-3-like repeated domain-containing protein n=1 Tax=Steinernema hermaphroditum TaxID=289476 RepID=A0AA39I9Y5_9BILA|nr:hypothetical protein QR680_014725 [Steinernema hermaphroditum]
MNLSTALLFSFCLSVAICFPNSQNLTYHSGNCRVQNGIVYEGDGSSRPLTPEDSQKLAAFQTAADEWGRELGRRIQEHVKQSMQNPGQPPMENPKFPDVPCLCASGCN